MLSVKKNIASVPAAAKSGGQADLPWSLDEHWPALVARLADQVTEGVSALQNSIDLLLSKERITRLEHRALSIPTERLKVAGISAQQINRFYGGRIRQSHEKVDMAQLVEGVLQERKNELSVLGIELRRKLKSVEVLVDPTVAYAFVNAVLDWGLPFGSRIDVRMDLNAWPRHARLQVRVSNDGLPPSSTAMLDSLSWVLIRQIAQTAGGIEIARETTDDGVNFTAMFTRTVQAVDGISAVELSDDHSSMFKSLSGIYVLTISPALQIRADVRDALREIGVLSDSVVDFEQAREAIRSRMPNLIVVDAGIKGDAFDLFRRELLREVFEFPFIEISPDDSSFDMSGFGELSMAKVGRGNIREALGTAVMFELAKMM
ncbi:hypothetical protein ASE11_20415 [Hydrogenophaga sp. Root209]|uniref:hypothetical protein n=1 Tax=unclassified Hydrogenophaga TaxID=2610897 RepID=UPI0006F44488|nr:hypothetical protein [Hydrogenophaga sp. Root209]KRC10387.1 hypothetical protein ASE11_20415 [Hydrogenophaga sp. Root209]